MIALVQPSIISGTIHAPASKSTMQRACAAALIRKGRTRIQNPGNSADETAVVEILTALGCQCTIEKDGLYIDSANAVIHAPSTPDHSSISVDCGESGLAMRMFTPIAATSSLSITMNGGGSLLHRPMDWFDRILPLLAVEVETNGGVPPVRVRGPLQPADIRVDGSVSSQFLTGLLMAYACAAAKEVTITVDSLKSKRYIDLTLQLMKHFGLKVPVNNNYQSFYFDQASVVSVPSMIDYTVEGDWSGAAFLLVAAAIAGNTTFTGLDHTSMQADKEIVGILNKAGAEVRVSDDHVTVKKAQLRPFVFDATDCPDLFPPLVALAAHCNGLSRIRGLQRLRYKESDRGHALREEFDKLGTRIILDGDEMLVHGNEKLQVKNTNLDSHGDHRIAMACAVASLNADLGVEIHHAEAVKKSYAAFWEHLHQLNAAISLKS